MNRFPLTFNSQSPITPDICRRFALEHIGHQRRRSKNGIIPTKECIENEHNARRIPEEEGRGPGDNRVRRTHRPGVRPEDIAEVMADDMPDEDAALAERKKFGLKTMERREDIYPVIIPKYVIDPPIYADDDDDVPEDGIRVQDMHVEDKLGILGRLLNQSSGVRGARKGKTFLEDGRGSGDTGDSSQDKPDGK